MRHRFLFSNAFACLLAVAALSLAIQARGSQAPAAASHVMTRPADVKWGPAPPALPPGAQMAVLDGNPEAAGMFTIRAKFPDGYTIAPHTHPTDEHVTVVQGEITLGMGEKADFAAAGSYAAGSYLKMPAKMAHFARAKGEVIIQLHGQGPFVLNYVNPSDDPQKKKD